MKARIAPGYDTHRQTLADIIPLATPFTLFIAPSQLCNFKCNYCTHSLPPETKAHLGLKRQLLDPDTFSTLAQQAAEFPGQFKRVLLTGLGEPLVNPNIADMVATLVELNVAERYELFTNASLLTPELNRRLISSGLTYLRISIQGVSRDQYQKTAGADIDFPRLVANIADFYENRRHCKVYIKIIDSLLASPSDRHTFFDLFGGICDHIYIEHLLNAQPSMTEHYKDGVDNSVTFYGEHSLPREVCPYIFYTLQTDARGNVFPCPPLGLPPRFSVGNIQDTSLRNIWNGEKLKRLRLSHLKRRRHQFPVCRSCDCYKAFTPDSDSLDHAAQRLIPLFDRVA